MTDQQTAIKPADGQAAPDAGERPTAEQVVRDVQQRETETSSDTDAGQDGQERRPTQGERAEGQDGERREEDPDRRRRRVDFQERMNQQTRRRRMAERERDTALRENAELRRQMQSLRPRDFHELPEGHQQDIRSEEAALRADQRAAERRARISGREAEEAAIEAHNARTEDFVERLQAFDKTTPGTYDRVAQLAIPETMAAYVAESEVGVELISELSKPEHASTLRKIQRASDENSQEFNPSAAIRELARFEVRFSKPEARRTSNAPDPGTTLNGGKKTPAVQDLRDLAKGESPADYIKQRQAAMAKGE